MTSATATARRGAEAAQPLADRVLPAMPLVTIYVWLALVYAWQAWLTPTPSIFPDELQYAELARAIAEHGRPALRGEEHGWVTLAAWLTAPAWLIRETADAYLTAKLIGALAMASVVFPAYGLARLVAPRGPSLFAAVAAGVLPATSYSARLMQEPFAYPAATLGLYLIVRALARPTTGAVVAAALVCAIAALVRDQLVLLPIVFVGAAGLRAWQSERVSSQWARLHAVGRLLLVAGAVALLAATHLVLTRLSLVWREAAQTPGALAEYAIWALGALALGLGVLPVVAALAVSANRAREPADPAWKAFVAVLTVSIVAFALYTGAKVAYLADFWMTPVEERNVIYLAPLFLAGSARWLARPRASAVAVAGAALVTLAVLRLTPSILDLPYFEAPGFALLAGLHRDGVLGAETVANAEIVLVALSAVVVLTAGALRSGRRLAAGAATAVILMLGAGQLYASSGQRALAEQLRSEYGATLDWVDRAGGGREAAYLGRAVVNPNAVHTLEFWNKSVTHVGSLDGSAPGPGREHLNRVVALDGGVAEDPGVPLVVTDGPVTPVGRLLATEGRFRLYEVDPPLRVAADTEGMYTDGWAAGSAAYTRFVPAPRHVEVTVSRTAWLGQSPRSAVVVRAGTVGITPGGATIATTTAEQRGWVTSGSSSTYRLSVPAAPYRVEVVITPTFVPAERDSRSSDTRELGAQVSFQVPDEDQ